MWWSFYEACPGQSERCWSATSAEHLPGTTYYCYLFPHVKRDKIVFVGRGAVRSETIHIVAMPWICRATNSWHCHVWNAVEDDRPRQPD